MLKFYTYTPEDCGLGQFPPGELRLRGQSVSPQDAQAFIMPVALRNYPEIDKLPYFKGNESKHVFFNVAEDVKLWYNQPSLFIRCDATKEIKSHDPNTIGWPWPVKDYADYCNRDFEYDVVFQGWASTPLTEIVCESVGKTQLNTHIQIHDYFFGYHYDDPNYKHLIESYLDTLSRGRLSLVPRSIPEGVVRYRFYESLSMGRVPVHFCDWRILPFENEIDWSRCSIHIPESRAGQTGEILTEWLGSHSDQEIIEMGKYGRKMWETYLDSSRWVDLMTMVVEKFINR